MPFPALIQNVPESGLIVGGLTLLDRLIVTLHRAGAGPILVVSAEPLPSLARTHALGIPITLSQSAPANHPGTLLARANVLLAVEDAREIFRHRARLVTANRTRPPGALPVRFVDADEPLVFEPGIAAAQATVEASAVAGELRTESDARVAADRLWATLTSSSDGIVDCWFNRPCGRPLSRLLVRTPITPNQVSVASILLGLLSAWFLARGTWLDAVLGAVLFQVSAVVDCVDGDVARIVFKESPLGKWLDLVGDQLVHSSVFIGITVGLLRTGTNAPAGWLGLSAVVGALLSFGVVLRGMVGEVRASGRLQALIDRATNRDFSVLVLALALGGMLEWFLWMAAVGSHLFWLTALFLQRRSPAPRPELAEGRAKARPEPVEGAQSELR